MRLQAVGVDRDKHYESTAGRVSADNSDQPERAGFAVDQAGLGFLVLRPVGAGISIVDIGKRLARPVDAQGIRHRIDTGPTADGVEEEHARERTALRLQSDDQLETELLEVLVI